MAKKTKTIKPVKVVKVCRNCAFYSFEKGCKLVSGLCANTSTRPSFMKPGDLIDDKRMLVIPATRIRLLNKPNAKIFKEVDFESQSSKRDALKTGQSFGPINRRFEGTLN